MERVDFSTWWSDFLADPRIRGAKDGGWDAVERLRRYMEALSPEARTAFTLELAAVACARSEGNGLALGALEEHCSPEGFALIADRVASLMASTAIDDRSYLSDCLRVLAKSVDAKHRQCMQDYLLSSPIDPYWSSVPWALWPDSPALFGRSWARYFTAEPPTVWRNTVIVQAFLSRAEALICVRNALRAIDETVWDHLREALLRGIDSPWLDETMRGRLKSVCEGGG